jgi:hypothetical protein
VGTGSIAAPGDAARKEFLVMMPNFGFAPGIVDYWMLLIDWPNETSRGAVSATVQGNAAL